MAGNLAEGLLQGFQRLCGAGPRGVLLKATNLFGQALLLGPGVLNGAFEPGGDRHLIPFSGFQTRHRLTHGVLDAG